MHTRRDSSLIQDSTRGLIDTRRSPPPDSWPRRRISNEQCPHACSGQALCSAARVHRNSRQHFGGRFAHRVGSAGTFPLAAFRRWVFASPEKNGSPELNEGTTLPSFLADTLHRRSTGPARRGWCWRTCARGTCRDTPVAFISRPLRMPTVWPGRASTKSSALLSLIVRPPCGVRHVSTST